MVQARHSYIETTDAPTPKITPHHHFANLPQSHYHIRFLHPTPHYHSLLVYQPASANTSCQHDFGKISQQNYCCPNLRCITRSGTPIFCENESESFNMTYCWIIQASICVLQFFHFVNSRWELDVSWSCDYPELVSGTEGSTGFTEEANYSVIWRWF